MSILNAKNITKSFTIEHKKITILNNISLKIKQGEFVAIVGPSGSGKSTLLSIIAGLDKPDSGEVFINNKEITSLPEDELSEMRNKEIGFVFQSFFLIPSLTAFENVSFPLELSKKKNFKIVNEFLKEVGIYERKNNYPSQLSGGEKQRVAIARALINKPKILFADEPTGNLDSKNSLNIINLLIKFQKEFNITLVIVTHEKKISNMASRIIEIEDGIIISDKNNE